MQPNDLKAIVKEKYGDIATLSKDNSSTSCCSTSSCCSNGDYTIFSESYKNISGYNPDADLNLGCGLPTQYANIKSGDWVLDLGSGAGNDCFVAQSFVGNTGKVFGLDFTEAMVAKAQKNCEKLGLTNITFVEGDIEEMPFEDNLFDLIISNCVLNLIPDKNRAFSQMLRVLKPGGRFCISDVVLKGELPENIRRDAAMYAGCISGAIDIDNYLEIIEKQGFTKIIIHKQKAISIPTESLEKHLSINEIQQFEKGEIGIISITISGTK